MTNLVQDLVKQKMFELEHGKSETVNLTIRISPMHGLMVKTLSRALDFPISSTFTDLVSKQIEHALLQLNEAEAKRLYEFLSKNDLLNSPSVTKVKEHLELSKYGPGIRVFMADEHTAHNKTEDENKGKADKPADTGMVKP